MNQENIIAIIPARGGSKGIPRKNIIDLGGYPLIAYSIVAAKMSKMISRVIVSTDSEEIAKIAKGYGAEVPFLRPAEFATDKAGDYEVLKHALNWLKENENFEPDYLVHLRPTTPLRDPKIIDEAIKKFVEADETTALRSAHELKESPHKFFEIKNRFFAGLFMEDSNPDFQNLPRQDFATAYHPNGYVDVLKTKTILNEGVLHGKKITPFITPFLIELDGIDDIDYIKFDLSRKELEIYDFLKNNYGR